MKRQGGFTLIELVVVIVILGILAVTAAPKFLNLQSDARASSLQGLKGAMAGAAGIVYGKAAINGVEQEKVGAISDGENTISLVSGYPAPTVAGIGAVVVGLNDATEWEITTLSTSAAADTIVYRFANNGSETCVVTYKMAEKDTSPTIQAATADGC